MGKKLTYEELEKKVEDLEVRLEEQQQATERFCQDDSKPRRRQNHGGRGSKKER